MSRKREFCRLRRNVLSSLDVSRLTTNAGTSIEARVRVHPAVGPDCTVTLSPIEIWPFILAPFGEGGLHASEGPDANYWTQPGASANSSEFAVNFHLLNCTRQNPEINCILRTTIGTYPLKEIIKNPYQKHTLGNLLIKSKFRNPRLASSSSSRQHLSTP